VSVLPLKVQEHLLSVGLESIIFSPQAYLLRFGRIAGL